MQGKIGPLQDLSQQIDETAIILGLGNLLWEVSVKVPKNETWAGWLTYFRKGIEWCGRCFDALGKEDGRGNLYAALKTVEPEFDGKFRLCCLGQRFDEDIKLS